MTTHQDAIMATAPIALRAVARHMLDHDLDVDSISAPLASMGETSVIVHVSGENDGYWSARWADTLAVDGKTTEPSAGGIYTRFIVHGRLPDSGIRVSVVAVQVVASSLSPRLALVPDGAA